MTVHPRAAPRRSNRIPGLPDESISLRYDFFWLFEEVAPNSSRFHQFGKCSSKCLDG